MSWFAKNLKLSGKAKVSPWRRAALAAWGTPTDPSIYGFVDLRAEPAMQYLKAKGEASGEHFTITHFATVVMARIFGEFPEVNVVIRRGTLYRREGVDITLTVASDDKGADLGAVTLRGIERASLSALAKEIRSRSERVKRVNDPEHQLFKKVLSAAPGLLRHIMVKLAEFSLFELNLWTRLFGLPKCAFGVCFVTNVGSLGLDLGLAALVPSSRSVMMVSLAKVAKLPWVEGDQVIVADVLRIGFTVDHRVVDAVPLARMAKRLREYFAEPRLIEV